MDNLKYNLTAGIISFTLYGAIVFFFLFYINTAEVKKVSALNKTTVLELDIVIEEKKEEEVQKASMIKTPDAQKSKIEKKVVKKSSSVSATKKTDLKSLFANVTTKATKVRKEKVLNVKKSTIASRYKSKFEKDKKVEKLNSANLKEVKKVQKKNVVAQMANDEKDPYFSKIYQIISSRWQPVVFYEDLIAKVIITISNNGSFSYKFIQYSNNMGFDNQLKTFLNSQSTKQYPVNSNGKPSTIEITFQAKG